MPYHVLGPPNNILIHENLKSQKKLRAPEKEVPLAWLSLSLVCPPRAPKGRRPNPPLAGSPHIPQRGRPQSSHVQQERHDRCLGLLVSPLHFGLSNGGVPPPRSRASGVCRISCIMSTNFAPLFRRNSLISLWIEKWREISCYD